MKSAVKGRIKILVFELMRFADKLFWIFPIRKGRVLFSCFWGKRVADNPYAIYQYLKEQGRDYTFVWEENSGTYDDEEDTKYVKRYSLKWFYYMATAQVIVSNAEPMPFAHRRGQLRIQTWHAGGAYKRVGSSLAADPYAKWYADQEKGLVDLFLSSSYVFTKSNIEAHGYRGEILNCGMPRNDLLFDREKISAAAQKIKTRLNIDGKIILYAPTYRGASRDTVQMDASLPVSELVCAAGKRFGQQVKILVRYHYLDRNAYGHDEGTIDVSDYPDMQELLCAADILITDYSSCMWECALLGKPCLLYVPDLADYMEKDRGFFTPIEEWPGVICRNRKELVENIGRLDEAACKKTAEAYLSNVDSYENGHAAEAVCGRIMRHIEGNEN